MICVTPAPITLTQILPAKSEHLRNPWPGYTLMSSTSPGYSNIVSLVVASCGVSRSLVFTQISYHSIPHFFPVTLLSFNEFQAELSFVLRSHWHSGSILWMINRGLEVRMLEGIEWAIDIQSCRRNRGVNEHGPFPMIPDLEIRIWPVVKVRTLQH